MHKLLIALLLVSGAAIAQQSPPTSGDQMRAYWIQQFNAIGQPTGTAKNFGNVVQFYDANGQAVGTMTNTGSPLDISNDDWRGAAATKEGELSRPLEYQGNGEWR